MARSSLEQGGLGAYMEGSWGHGQVLEIVEVQQLSREPAHVYGTTVLQRRVLLPQSNNGHEM